MILFYFFNNLKMHGIKMKTIYINKKKKTETISNAHEIYLFLMKENEK